jgi:CRP-like cAMP-binding protein
MAADNLVSALARLPLFHGLSTHQLAEIVRHAEHAVFHPGAMVIEENAEGDAAILIVSTGAVRVSGPELKSRMEPIPAGSLLGESAMLIDATTHGSTIVARTHVRGLRISRDALHAQMAADPSLADHLVQNIARRLTRMAEELREIDELLGGETADTTATTLPAASKSPPLPAPPPVH